MAFFDEKLQVLQYFDETGRAIVHRHPSEGATDIRLGTQLVVQDNQEAVFFRSGRGLDAFGPGRHTLTTLNLPLLSELLGRLFEDSPFQAAVYFVSKQTFVDLKWGTRQAIAYRDSELGIVRLRGFGRYSLRVRDSSLFIRTIVGTRGHYDSTDIQDFLRDAIVARLTDLLGENLKTILELPAAYDELAELLKARVAADFGQYGLELADFFIGGITPPDEVQKLMDQRAGMGALGDLDRYVKFRAAQALGAVASGDEGTNSLAAGGVGLGVGVSMGRTLARLLDTAAGGTAESSPAAGGPAPAFCAACGKPLPAAARFCPRCGAATTG